MKYENTDEVREDCIKYFDDTIEKWEALGSENERNFPPLEFTRKNKNGEERLDICYCSFLCGYSKDCPHFHKFLDTWDAKNEDEDLW